MKKILSMIGAMTLIGTTSTRVVACGDPIPSTRTDISNKITSPIDLGQLDENNKQHFLAKLQTVLAQITDLNTITPSDYDVYKKGTTTVIEDSDIIAGTSLNVKIGAKATSQNFKGNQDNIVVNYIKQDISTDLNTIIKVKDLGVIDTEENIITKSELLKTIQHNNSSAKVLTVDDFNFKYNPTTTNATIVGNKKYKGEITLNYNINNFIEMFGTNGPIKSLATNQDGTVYAGTQIKHYEDVLYRKKTTENKFDDFGVTRGSTYRISGVTTIDDNNVYIGLTDEFTNYTGTIYTANNIGTCHEVSGTTGVIKSLATDKYGTVYAGTQTDIFQGKIYRKKTTENKFFEISGTDGVISSLTVDNSNNIYAGSQNGNVYKSNGTDAFTAMSGTNGVISSLTVDNSNNIYAGSQNGNVYKSNGTDAFTAMSGETSGSIKSLATDKDGTLYVGTQIDDIFQGKIYRKKTTENKFFEISGTNGAVLSLATDKYGTVYAGTQTDIFQGKIYRKKVMFSNLCDLQK